MYVPVNRYGHVETVSSPNHTFFLSGCLENNRKEEDDCKNCSRSISTKRVMLSFSEMIKYPCIAMDLMSLSMNGFDDYGSVRPLIFSDYVIIEAILVTSDWVASLKSKKIFFVHNGFNDY